MKKIILFLCTIAFLSSCNDDKTKVNSEDDYSWISKSMSVESKSNADASRIVSLKENTLHVGINITPEDNMTATCVTLLSNNLIAVSYHARGGAMKGIIEIYEQGAEDTATIKNSLTFGARVNNITSDGQNRIFASMDTNNGPAVVAIGVNSDGTFADTQTINYKILPGESANGLTYVRNTSGEFVYVSTGGDAIYNGEFQSSDFEIYDFLGTKKVSMKEYFQKPGFQKLTVSGLNITPFSFQGNANNRGRWIATNDSAVATMHFSRHLPNGIHASIQYYPNGLNQFFQRVDYGKLVPLDVATSMESKNVALLSEGVDASSKILYLCLENKGFQSYNISANGATHISTYNKPVTAAAFGTDGDIYLGCGLRGVCRIKNDNGIFAADKEFKMKAVENEQPASVNFVAVKGDKVYIAYGVKGLVVLDKNSPLFVQSK